MNRNETKKERRESHLPNSVVKSHFIRQKEVECKHRSLTKPRPYTGWEFQLKMSMPDFSFFWGMKDEVLLTGPDTGTVFNHNAFLSVRKELEEIFFLLPEFPFCCLLASGDMRLVTAHTHEKRHTETVISITEKPILNLALDGHRKTTHCLSFTPGTFAKEAAPTPQFHPTQLLYVLLEHTRLDG